MVSGGGAGHEPALAGYVGHGMLMSVVSGDIFASTSAKQILAAIEFAAFAGLDSAEAVKGRDMMVVINNYTGGQAQRWACGRTRALHLSRTAFELIADGQVEMGLGLHNEPGVRRVPLTSPAWLIAEMVCDVRGSGGGWRGSDIYIGASVVASRLVLNPMAHRTEYGV